MLTTGGEPGSTSTVAEVDDEREPLLTVRPNVYTPSDRAPAPIVNTWGLQVPQLAPALVVQVQAYVKGVEDSSGSSLLAAESTMFEL